MFASIASRRRRNSWIRWRGMHLPITVPACMSKAANSEITRCRLTSYVRCTSVERDIRKRTNSDLAVCDGRSRSRYGTAQCRGASVRVWRSDPRPQWADAATAQDDNDAAGRRTEAGLQHAGRHRATLMPWRSTFLAGEAALASGPESGEALENDRRKVKLSGGRPILPAHLPGPSAGSRPSRAPQCRVSFARLPRGATPVEQHRRHQHDADDDHLRVGPQP